MGLFKRFRDATVGSSEPADPLEALKDAQEALAKTNFASDGNGHYTRLDDATKQRMTEGLARAEASLRGGAGTPAGFEAGAWASPAPAPGGDSISKLERLAKLRADGVLTDDEFEAQKRQVLAEG